MFTKYKHLLYKNTKPSCNFHGNNPNKMRISPRSNFNSPKGRFSCNVDLGKIQQIARPCLFNAEEGGLELYPSYLEKGVLVTTLAKLKEAEIIQSQSTFCKNMPEGGERI